MTHKKWYHCRHEGCTFRAHSSGEIKGHRYRKHKAPVVLTELRAAAEKPAKKWRKPPTRKPKATEMDVLIPPPDTQETPAEYTLEQQIIRKILIEKKPDVMFAYGYVKSWLNCQADLIDISPALLRGAVAELLWSEVEEPE